MYTFCLSVLEFAKSGTLHWYMLFFLFIIIRWLIVYLHAGKYRPYEAENAEYFTSVLIPVVDEDPRLFAIVLENIIKQRPSEVIVVMNGPYNPDLFNISFGYLNKQDESGSIIPFQILYTPEPGKRNAIRLGLKHTDPRSEITVLVDSDTLWEENMLKNLLMPFASDVRIGGVTTRQRIYRPNRSIITIIASILEEIRAEGTMKAMSSTGKVGCLPGRTIAFRTEILKNVIYEFMEETFMGIHKEVSDDRSLTNLALKAGYRTVLQDTAVVYTDAPVKLKKFCRQQLRWAEGSQYNNICMLPWMLGNAKLMLFIYLSDMFMPFLLLSVYINTVVTVILGGCGIRTHALPYSSSLILNVVLILSGACLGFGVRNYRIIKKIPAYYIILFPFLVLFLGFIMAPIRIAGLYRCADAMGWGTRRTKLS